MKKWIVLLLVCTLGLTGCGKETVQAPEEHWDLIPMVMVDGELYLDTGYRSSDARCGVMDGEITSAVEGWEKPAEDGQSNFGAGYGYQYGTRDGTIEILMNGKWFTFATEAVRQEIQFPGTAND